MTGNRASIARPQRGAPASHSDSSSKLQSSASEDEPDHIDDPIDQPINVDSSFDGNGPSPGPVDDDPSPSQLDRRRLEHLNAWGGSHGLAVLHSLAAENSEKSAKNKQNPSKNIRCECGELAGMAFEHTGDATIAVYSCATKKCDFLSGEDGRDVMQFVWQFQPGTKVRFTKLPDGYSWVEGCDPQEEESFGHVAEFDVVCLHDGGGFDISVLVPLGADRWVKVEGSEDTFDSVWFSRQLVTVVDAPSPDNHTKTQPQPHDISGKHSASNSGGFPALSIVRFDKLPDDCRWQNESSAGGEGRVLQSYRNSVLVDVGKPVIFTGGDDGADSSIIECVYFHPSSIFLKEKRPFHRAASALKSPTEAAFFTTAPPNSLRPHVVRYTTVYQTIGFLGSNFSQEKHDTMTRQDWQRWFRVASKPLAAAVDISCFVSYRWLMGRWLLFPSLLVHFNYLPAVIISICITVLLMFFAGLISGYGGVRVLPFGIYYDGATSDFEVWWFCVPCRLLLFLLLFAVWSQLFSRKKLFLDRNCIAQVAVDDQLCMASLRHLPYILSRCKELLCIVDAEYFNRLWCLYEVAIYMKVRDNGRLKFVYCWQCVLFLAIFGMQALIRVTGFILATPGLGLSALYTVHSSTYFLQYVVNGIMVVQWVTIYWIGRFYFRTAQEIRKQSTEFDVRRAACGVEDDKPIILDFIREQFKEASASDINSNANTDPIDLFNRAVRKLLARHSFSRFGYILPYGFVVAAYSMRWYATSDIGPDMWTLDMLDWLFYQTPNAKKPPRIFVINEGPAKQLDFRWYAIFIVATFNIFVRWPLMFYVESLIVKLMCLLEDVFPKVVRWWNAWLPVVLLFAIWENVETMSHEIASEAVDILWKVGSQQATDPTGSGTFSEPIYFELFNYLFQCFGTNCLTFDFNISYTKGVQIVGLFIFIGEGVFLFLIHQPSWFRRLHRALWRKLSGNAAADSAVLSPAVSSARLSNSTSRVTNISYTRHSAVRQRRGEKSFDGEVSDSGDEAATALLPKKSSKKSI